MDATTQLAELLTVEPHEPTILVRINPGNLSDESLDVVRRVVEPSGKPSDSLRLQVQAWVSAELARRLSPETTEPAAWVLNWHAMDDRQLQAALAASFSWLQMGLPEPAQAALTEVHRAMVTAACTRLGELHDAIQSSYGVSQHNV